MNKTFKVARSLTRGTVVTSEKASSYQGKAVKTVIAAAAMMMAGGAMATATEYSEVTVNEGTSVVFENGTIIINGTTSTGKTGSATTADKIADKTEVSFKDAPKFTGGSIVVNAGYKQSETINQESTDFGTADTQIKGNISVNAYQGAKQDASLTLQNIGISEGEINFGIVAKDADDETAADAVKTGTSTLSAGTVTLGFYSGKPENGNVVSKQVSVKNVEDLTASVTAST